MLAKPTRSIYHAGASRWATTPPSLHSSRARFAKKPAAEHRAAHADAHPGEVLGLPSGSRRALDRRSLACPRGPPRIFGAPNARAPSPARPKSQPAPQSWPRTRPATGAPRLRPSLNRRRLENPVAPAAVADNAAAGNDPVASGSGALVNDGGTLRSFAAGQRLKSVEEEAATPVLLPPLRVASLYDSSGRLIVPPPLYGSHRGPAAPERDGRPGWPHPRARRRRSARPPPRKEAGGPARKRSLDGRLPTLPENRRFSLPWTAAFLAVLARDGYASFHSPLQVDSAVRTIAVQQRLVRTNGNAAPTSGDTASPHLTGARPSTSPRAA